MPPLDRHFASRLLQMVDSGLVNSRFTVPWADSLIEASESPPMWLLELAMATYQGDCSRVIREFVFSEPFLAFDEQFLGDYHLACLYLRYARRDLSWASFLSSAGRFADNGTTSEECEYFYQLLNELEASEYDIRLESKQAGEVAAALQQSITRAKEDIRPLLA